MSITEQSRNRLRTYLEETMGEEHASTMMDHLLPVGWEDLATRRDVEELGAATRRDVEELGAATRRDVEELGAATRRDVEELGAATRRGFAGVEAEFKAVRAEMAGEFKAVRAEMAGEFRAVHKEMEQMATKAGLEEVRSELHRLFHRQTLALVGLVITLNATTVAALRL